MVWGVAPWSTSCSGIAASRKTGTRTCQLGGKATILSQSLSGLRNACSCRLSLPMAHQCLPVKPQSHLDSPKSVVGSGNRMEYPTVSVLRSPLVDGVKISTELWERIIPRSRLYVELQSAFYSIHRSKPQLLVYCSADLMAQRQKFMLATKAKSF